MSTVSAVLRVVNEASPSLDAAAQSAARADDAMEDLDKAADAVEDELDQVGDAAERLGDKLGGVGGGASRATDGLDEAGRAAQELGPKMKRAAAGSKDLADVGGEASSIMSGLAGALELVSPEAADTAMVLADMAGGFEAVAKMGGMAVRILGPVGVVVGGLALAYQALASDVEAAEKRMAEANKRASEAQALAARLEGVRIQAAVARGEMTEAEGAGELAMAQAKAEYAKQQKEAREGLRKTMVEQLKVEKRLGEIRQRQRQGDYTQQEADEVVQLTAELDRLAPKLEMAQRKIDNLVQAERRLASDLFTIATSSSQAADAHTKRADAAEKAGKKEVEATLTRAEAIARVAAVAPQSQKVGLAGAELAEVNAEFQRIDLGQDSSSQWLDAQLGENNALKEAERMRRAQMGSTIAQAVAGNPAALTGLMGGPAGVAATAGVGALTSIGQSVVQQQERMSELRAKRRSGTASEEELAELAKLRKQGPAAGVRQQVMAFKTAFIEGLKALPSIIEDVIPAFITAFISELIRALPSILYKSVLAAFEAIWKLIQSFLSPLLGDPDAHEAVRSDQRWTRIGAASGMATGAAVGTVLGGPIGTAIGAGVGAIAGGTIGRVGGWLSRRKKHSGGLADDEMIAVLKQGETVVPDDGAATSRGRQAMRASGGPGGPGVSFQNCNFAGPDSIDWILRELNRQHGRAGRGSAPAPWVS